MQLPDKVRVREALIRALERSIETMAQAAKSSREGAVHEDSRAEGDKDMRATEQSYLARGQAMRVEELAEQLQRLQVFALARFEPDMAIAPGALVLADVDDTPRLLFVVPHGGGSVLQVDDTVVTVVTPSSPVGQALLGKFVGDEFEIVAGARTRQWTIEAIA
jgi:transcription elongation GreA/GreB family factor